VGLSIMGPIDDLPEDVGLSAYRIVQQALTNTLSHGGPGVTARVEVRKANGELLIDVVTTGRVCLPVPVRPTGPGSDRDAGASGALRRGPRRGPTTGGRLRGSRPYPAGDRQVSIRVLVVDDQELVRAGFVMIIDHQSDLEVVGEAADGAEAVAQARTLQPDVVLMDLRMPVALAAAHPIRILVLTTFDDDQSVYASLRAGASGFLLKDVPPRELADAVRVVAAGQSLFAPTVTRRIIERFVAQRPLDKNLQRRAELLSEREQEVLRCVGKGLTNAQIAGRLFVGEATIKSHVSHILGKLGARDRAQAVAFAYEAGMLPIGSLDA
jgi:DNA-binding NarL/FixJ family response regulator